MFFTFLTCGSQPSQSQIRSMGAFTGLDIGFQTEIKLPVVSSSAEATLVTLVTPDQLEAFNTDGSSAGVVTMTGTRNVAETLIVTGAAIERAVTAARQNGPCCSGSAASRSWADQGATAATSRGAGRASRLVN